MREMVASTLWGDWVLGDLVDCTRFVANALGPAIQVAEIRVSTPSTGSSFDTMPTVTVVTKSPRDHVRLRRAAMNCEWCADQVTELSSAYWSAVLGGVYVVLRMEGDQ